MPHTNTCLSTIRFLQNGILKVIRKLGPSKAHGHDEISIRMLKLSEKAFCKPLCMIFASCLETGVFPIHWKKASVVPIHKKEIKHLIKNYRPVLLLRICGKIFERLIYNDCQHNLMSSHQSGFKRGDSCINQFPWITHEIYKSFDEGFEVRGLFLDISQAFDSVWHDGLMLRLQENGNSGKLLLLLKDFLKSRKKRVVLNSQHSSWRDVNAGVSQGSLLGPLLLLVYINDLSNSLKSNPKLFANDTSLFSVIYDVN